MSLSGTIVEDVARIAIVANAALGSASDRARDGDRPPGLSLVQTRRFRKACCALAGHAFRTKECFGRADRRNADPQSAADGGTSCPRAGRRRRFRNDACRDRRSQKPRASSWRAEKAKPPEGGPYRKFASAYLNVRAYPRNASASPPPPPWRPARRDACGRGNAHRAAGSRHSKPASMKILSRPSASACSFTRPGARHDHGVDMRWRGPFDAFATAAAAQIPRCGRWCRNR